MNYDFSIKTIKIKEHFNKLPFTIQLVFIERISTKQFLLNKHIFPELLFNQKYEIYNHNALKIQRFYKKKIVFEYGRKWRLVSWNYLKNNPRKFYNTFCSVSAKVWKPIDFLTPYHFCFQKSGGCHYYPRVCFFCSCPNGDCLTYLEPYIFPNSVKIIL